MVTIKSAETPLQFAYLAAQQFSFESTQIHSLRVIASVYAKSGTPDDLVAGLAVLEEARPLQLLLILRHLSEFVDEYPTFAFDYVALGRPDLAHDVITESIRIADGLSSKSKVATLAMVADISHSMGNTDQCMDVLRTIAPYLQRRKRFRSVDDSFATTLVMLYLGIGKVEVALSIAERTTGFEKANGFAELAFHDQPANQCCEPYLGTALRIATTKKYEYSTAFIAGHLAKNGQFDRALLLIAGIGKNYVRFEAMLDIAIYLCEAGRTTDAVSVLDLLAAEPDSFYHYNSNLIKRLIPMLLHEHRDVVSAILDRTRTEAECATNELDRLQRLTCMVGLVAMYSRTETEVLVDLVLDAPLAEFDKSEYDPIGSSNRPSVCILFELLITIVEHGLQFDCTRKQKLREHLESL